jgi:thymidylate kinase
MVICFQGIDGSGKTFQAHNLVEQLNEAGIPAVYVWCGSRSALTRPFVMLGKRLLGAPSKRKAPRDTEVGAGESAKEFAFLANTGRIFGRRWIRALWLHLSLTEHMLKIWSTVLPHVRQGRIVVCDRYIYDSVISTAYAARLDAAQLPTMLRSPQMALVPRLDRCFYLDVPAEVAFSRKADIADLRLVESRVPLYRTAASVLDMEVIDGTGSPQKVAEAVRASLASLVPDLSRSIAP